MFRLTRLTRLTNSVSLVNEHLNPNALSKYRHCQAGQYNYVQEIPCEPAHLFAQKVHSILAMKPLNPVVNQNGGTACPNSKQAP